MLKQKPQDDGENNPNISLVISIFLYACESWTVNKDLKTIATEDCCRFKHHLAGMDRAQPEWDVEGARGPCALEKEWTEQSLNGMWREPEDRVP